VRFHYSMQKLVDLKSNEKAHAEWMLSKAIGQLHEEESSLSHLVTMKDSMQNHLLGQAARTTTVAELIQMQEYVIHLNNQIHRKHQDVLFAKQMVTDRQESLTEKMKEEKVWAKAKERAYEKYMTIVRKKEQEEMDEIASVRRVETI
jgi:flagellar protein FliJ